MINQVKTILDYKGSLVETWLEIVDDSGEDYILAYDDVSETYYTIDRRNVLQIYKE